MNCVNVSAKTRLQIFSNSSCMNGASLTKYPKIRARWRQYPVVSLTLLAIVAMALPTPGMAQMPKGQNAALKLALNQAGPYEGAYTLGAGDRVRLDIFNVPEYSGEYQVLVDGTINLPIVGSVSVQGLTLTGASNVIASQFARYLKRPLLTVSLLAARPLKIAISGEVNRAGSYTIPLTEGRQFPTVSQAIQLAGGTTQVANIRQVQVRRQGRGLIAVNLGNVLQTGDPSQDVTLRDGDTVFIPTVADVNSAETLQVANSNLATQSTGPFKVAIVGEVSRQGTYLLQGTTNGPNGLGKPPSLTQAILGAGGLTPSANISQIQVRRPTRTGEVRTINVNLMQLLQTGDISQDVLLQEGDTVLIPTQTELNASQSRILGTSTLATQATEPLKIALVGDVNRPGTYTITGQSTSTAGTTAGVNKPATLTQAIQVAGGIKSTADIRSIKIRRYNRNGAEQTLDANLWQLLQSGDLSQDIILQDGDTISIPTATRLDPTEAEALALSSFSPNSIRVNVVGEVVRQGVVEVPPNTPLNQALLAAGGFNQNRARRSSVELIRLEPNGTVTKRTVPIDLSQGINPQTNPTLRNNDVIVVRRSGLAATSDTLGTVLSPLGGIFTLFNFFRIFQ